MSRQTLMAIHQIVVEIFQPEPRDGLTQIYFVIPRSTTLASPEGTSLKDEMLKIYDFK